MWELQQRENVKTKQTKSNKSWRIPLMVTTNPKPVIDRQKIKSKLNITLQNSSITEKFTKKKGLERNYKNNRKTVDKMAISPYLWKITSNVNGLKALIKRYRVMTGLKKQNKTKN